MSLARGNESLNFSGMDMADLQNTPHPKMSMNPNIPREIEGLQPADYSSRLSTPGGSYDNTYPRQGQGQMNSVMNHFSNQNQNQVSQPQQNQYQSHPSNESDTTPLERHTTTRVQGNTHNNIFGEPPASPSMKKEYKMSSDIFCTGRIIDESGQHKRSQKRVESGTRIHQNSSTLASPHVDVDSYHRDAVRNQYSNSNENIIGPTSTSSHQLLSQFQQQRQPITASASLDGNMSFNKNFNNNNERLVGESRSSESIASASHSNTNSGVDYGMTPDRKPNARENGFNPVTGTGYTEVELPKSQRRHFAVKTSTPLW